MTFITAWLAVAGAAAMVIPIIIHLLFRRRRKPIPWGAMRLLLEAIRRHKRRARIEQLLLLTVRCLILLLIGLALAEPILAGFKALATGSRVVVLVIDDGLISGIQDVDGRVELEDTIETATSLIDELDPGDRVAVVRTSHPARELTEGPTVDMEGVRKLLGGLRPSSARSDVPAALDVADAVLDEYASDAPSSIVLLGSWRQGSIRSSQIESVRDSSDQGSLPGRKRELLTTVPVEDPRDVIAVESIKIRRPVNTLRTEDPPIRTAVTIRRLGTDLGSERSIVKVSGPGIEDSLPRQVDFAPGATRATIEFIGYIDGENATIDGTSAVLATVDDQVLPEASRRGVIVDTSPTIQVGIIDRNDFNTSALMEDVGASDWIERALEPGMGGMIEVDRIDPSALSTRTSRGLDAMIICRPDLLSSEQWPVLVEFVRNGRFILFVPPTDQEVNPWLDMMSSSFKLDWQVDIEVQDLDEPSGVIPSQSSGSLLSLLASEIEVLTAPVEIEKLIEIEPGPRDAVTMLETADGGPILLSWNPDSQRRGTLALLAVSPHLSWTTLPIKPLMVPLFQELVREGSATGRNATSILAGSHVQVPVTGARELTGAGGRSIQILLDGSTAMPVRDSGHWVARDASGTPLTTIVVNTDLDSAEPATVTSEEFRNWLSGHGDWELLENEKLVARFVDVQNNPMFSLVLLAAALLLLCIETALNRWFSRSRVTAGATQIGAAA